MDKNQRQVGKWKVTTDDTSTGSVMDTQRPATKGPYMPTKQIGPVSKTGFGQDKDDKGK